MISRRNIRVKVMQTLYALESRANSHQPEAEKMLTKKIGQTHELFVYLVYFITEVARYAETDARQKAGKHLPTANDLAVNTRITGNELLWHILEDQTFKSAVDSMKLESLVDREMVRKTYQALTLSEQYEEYISLPSRNKQTEKAILEFIFTDLMLPDELFISHLEEKFMNWDDDAEMMNTLVLNYLGRPNTSFNSILSDEKWKFAKDLLHTVLEKHDQNLELIKPKLNNWDAERIAALDMIILEMGVCEFLYFDTIPTRVTINEYIDLAKAYSTPQSGQFVNGILDNIHKDLAAQNRINKRNYKNSTL